MEQLARLESIQRVDGDLFLVTISVTTDWPGEEPMRPNQRVYRLDIDLERRTMTPRDELQDCFDVHHKFEYCDGLNPRLRRQWKTASLIDGIVDLLFKSRLLIPYSLPAGEDDTDRRNRFSPLFRFRVPLTFAFLVLGASEPDKADS